MTEQAKKTYVAAVATTTSTTASSTSADDAAVRSLREAFKKAHEQLKKDLMALRDGAMKTAREAVKGAFTALRAIPGVDTATITPPTATTTATTTSQ